jgi:putative spermidine/putrescine transport system ATP-binding protein
MSFLILEGVSKYYGDVGALIDLTLQVERGEFISLLGPSGCGKTTTLQAIAGLTPVTRGRMRLDGRDITNLPVNQRGLGVVFQSYALFPHMTVAENVSFGLEMRKMPKHERDTRIAQMLKLVHLEAHAQRYPRELSGGQRQRVAIARALVIAPPVLLLDEPLSNLDAKLREEMQFELRRIQRKVGTTTIMVTHDQAEALSISDRVVVMQAGRVTQIDAPYRLYEHPKTEFISGFVGKTNLLPGRVACGPAGTDVVLAQGQRVEVEGGDFPDGAAVTVCLRPEKLFFTAEAQGTLAARVEERFFLGSQWLYRVVTELGELEVSCANDGSAPLEEHAQVHLAWARDVARLVAPAEPAKVLA